jgi:dinuclear metal center YbgI/SA1388 family protein
MLLLHHPPFLKPLNDLRADRPANARLLEAAAAGVALFAAHTNLDAAPGGVNDALAARLGLVDTRPLVPVAGGRMAKLVTFVPSSHLEPVKEALFAAGCGRIGAYRDCAFASPGIGSFLAPAGGKPFSGRPGRREEVAESRLETILPQALADPAVAALLAAHPYEEPAYDIQALSNPPAGLGLGRVGRLDPPRPGREFLPQAAAALGANAPLAAGPCPKLVERVAVVGGSGGDMAAAAAAAGAQVFITGEARHHAGQEAWDLGLCLLTLGHYQTEAVVVEPWAIHLRRALKRAGLAARVRAWTLPADPWWPVSP